MKTLELLSFILLHARCEYDVVYYTEEGKKRHVSKVGVDESGKRIILYGISKPSELVKTV